MVRRPTSCRRINPFEAHFGQIECIDKRIDHANRVALVNEIIEAFGQQRPLPTIRLLNEAPHQFPPPRITGRIITAARRFHTWGNSGLGAILRLWESVLQESTRPTSGPCNDGERQWSTMSD